MSKILVIDDEPAICWGVAKVGEKLGHQVESAVSAEEGLKCAAADHYDAVVLDVRLPGIDGLSAIDQLRQFVGEAPIIVVTAFGDIDTAVKAVRKGAFEYLVKPFDVADIRSALNRALDRQHALPITTTSSTNRLLGESPVMRQLFKNIALAAAADANVLLQGESGVGKELVARAIHEHSAAAAAPFVAVNIASLSPALAESELFGHVAGAFTGASRDRPGLLAQANGGFLFLDEVAEIPLPLQVKLLRALEQGEVLPVGADRAVATRFRIIGASHQDLRQKVQAGEFRHDLYFRICAFEIPIPPLRERAGDIPLLAAHFASQLSNAPRGFADETLLELQRRPWHGNVRELRNAIEHAQVVARAGVVMPEHLPPPQPNFALRDAPMATSRDRLSDVSGQRAEELLSDPSAAGSVYNLLLSEVEGPLLERAMQRFDNECAPAARALGLHRTTLKRKLDEHHLPG